MLVFFFFLKAVHKEHYNMYSEYKDAFFCLFIEWFGVEKTF